MWLEYQHIVDVSCEISFAVFTKGRINIDVTLTDADVQASFLVEKSGLEGIGNILCCVYERRFKHKCDKRCASIFHYSWLKESGQGWVGIGNILCAVHKEVT